VQCPISATIRSARKRACERADGLQGQPPTLADLGVTKVQSSKWQKLAALPKEEFEDKIDFAKERSDAALM
jgi:hypothetical protein